jgi:hypothetical protein
MRTTLRISLSRPITGSSFCCGGQILQVMAVFLQGVLGGLGLSLTPLAAAHAQQRGEHRVLAKRG